MIQILYAFIEIWCSFVEDLKLISNAVKSLVAKRRNGDHIGQFFTTKQVTVAY
jgi:hypothetical protein